MTTLKLLSAGLVAAGMLTTPVLAQERYSGGRYVTEGYDTSIQPMPRYYRGYAGYAAGQGCAPAPRVGAFASEPWDNTPSCGPYGYSGY